MIAWKSISTVILLAAGCAFAQEPRQEIVLRWDFNNQSTKGWLPGFTDYSLLNGDLQRMAEIRRLPEEVDASRFGYYLQSMNRPDDLFMYLKRPLNWEDGIRPGQTYSATIDIEFLSNEPSGCIGAGGAPGEAVTLKAGLMNDEPLPLLRGHDVRINIDKGEQMAGGRDAGVAGSIANGLPCEPDAQRPYVFLHRVYHHPEPVTADDRGTLWVLVGTDSGYEGLTALYYYSIQVTLRPVPEN